MHVHVIPRWDKDKLVRYRPAKECIPNDVGVQQTKDLARLLDAPGSSPADPQAPYKLRYSNRALACRVRLSPV